MSASRSGPRGPMRMPAAALAALFALTCLTGCDDDPPARTVAVVVGRHAGAEGLLDSQGKAITPLSSAVDGILSGPGTVTVIANDGRPRVVKTIELAYAGGSRTQRDDAYAKNKKALETALLEARPVVAQADPTAALKLAGDAVRGKENPEVIAFDNGLSTTGTVLMQLGLIDLGTDAVDLARQSKGMLLDSFSGIVVQWHGLCSVVEPQPGCSAGVQQQLKTYYTTLVADADGRIEFDDAPLGGGVPPADDAPVVDIVRWQQRRLTPSVPASTATPTPNPIVKVLTEDLVRFQPRSDEYADRPAAERAIAELAPKLGEDRYPRVWVVGCTAKDPTATEDEMMSRSISRGKKIAADLQAHGATSQFLPGGRGWRCPGFRENEDAANRRVIVSSEPIP
ncbi:hypothetical protein AB0E63_42765 [Kribbella sp. NPDC026596]|uniref:hypothetical protein n=1 Tax=Kribbella sp. NPDC026596 TaxID=3155122 RepID=UPI0033DE3F6E